MIAIGCEALDEFFDKEVPKNVEDAFREHLAYCDRCERRLLGLMAEAMITSAQTAPTDPL